MPNITIALSLEEYLQLINLTMIEDRTVPLQAAHLLKNAIRSAQARSGAAATAGR